MARPRKVTSFSAGQAQYILEHAISDRKLSSADVNRYLSSMRAEISALEQRIARLKDAVVQPVKRVIEHAQAGIKVRKTRARRKALSAERIASQKLQGQYLGYLRQVPDGQRNRFKTLAKDQGREKAVAAMKKQLGK
jgi:O6-methylguanine-DNA--protein-cysteine methyltransferase